MVSVQSAFMLGWLFLMSFVGCSPVGPFGFGELAPMGAESVGGTRFTQSGAMVTCYCNLNHEMIAAVIRGDRSPDYSYLAHLNDKGEVLHRVELSQSNQNGHQFLFYTRQHGQRTMNEMLNEMWLLYEDNGKLVREQWRNY